MEEIKAIINNLPKGNMGESISFLSNEDIQKGKKFHESFPEYTETPLVSLNNLAEYLGVSKIFIKDESFRFGLNAFKVLGGSLAMAKYLAGILKKDISEVDYKVLTSKETKERLGDITFVTATDGNHGRGVAWTARKLGQKSVVYMPKGSSEIRLENIRAEGAEAEITNLNYDDAVRLAAEYAKAHNGVMVQDTAWEGYEDIPSWIMQGYGTIALEALEQMRILGVEKPTHIFVQAGVGSFASGILGFFASVFGEDCPKTIVVEASAADCIYKSALKGDGSLVAVGGDMNTIMAGLACGEANTIGWEILKNYSHAFVSCPDWVSAYGMRVLGNGLKDDRKVVSGESGAVSAGLITAVMRNSGLKDLKDILCLDENSKVLMFSTEGDTDPEKYLKIVWEGEYPLT